MIDYSLEIFKSSSSQFQNNAFSIIAIICILTTFKVASYTLSRNAYKLARKTKTLWDDILVEKRFLHFVSVLIACFGLLLISDRLFVSYQLFHSIIVVAIKLQLVIAIYLTIHSFFNSVLIISEQIPAFEDKPVKGYIQIIQIIGILITGIFCLAVIFQKPLIYFFSGIGATAALFLLVFKDSILGFVTSIQLTANQMVKKGDWIAMPKHNADGTVIDISLNTVKVQNWDKTISTIPTYAMISDSFQNWKGMEESGGRRIKRPIHIDLNTIKICDSNLLDNMECIDLISEYVQGVRKEIEQYNKDTVKGKHHINGRQVTNIGLFRKYIEQYLIKNKNIRKDLTFLVRQLQPGPTGLPIEIYVFTATTKWAEYESVQANIFDHLLAIAPSFDLKIFQNPSTSDYQALAQHLKTYN